MRISDWSSDVCSSDLVQGQPIAAHLSWMRSQGYTPDRCKIWLPHDGDTNDRVFDVSYRSAFEDAGYEVEVIPNQGKGAASARLEESGRAHVCTPVTNAHLVCRLLLEKHKTKSQQKNKST